MSRAALIRRLDELEARLREARGVQQRLALEELSDEQLEGLEAWYEAGEPGGPEGWQAWVESWFKTSRPTDVELRPVKRRERSPTPVAEVEEDLASSLAETPSLISEREQVPEPVPVPPDSEEVTKEPSASTLLRSCDYVPRSPWAGPPVERGESEEVTFRGEPLERVYGVRPPRRRRRRLKR